jgi:AraC family transcriptional regulator
VDQLARRAGLSAFHFIRAFRSAYGEPPHQYLRARRIDRARELLVTTPMPITEARAVGFQTWGLQQSVSPADGDTRRASR